MTKPIYFPHTYLSSATAAAIRSAFAAVVGYPPVAGRLTSDMRALADSGFLEIVTTAAEDEERLERALYLSGECRITGKYVNGEVVLA